jgi:hypothetical protein
VVVMGRRQQQQQEQQNRSLHNGQEARITDTFTYAHFYMHGSDNYLTARAPAALLVSRGFSACCSSPPCAVRQSLCHSTLCGACQLFQLCTTQTRDSQVTLRLCWRPGHCYIPGT